MRYSKEDFTYVLTLNSLSISFAGDSRVLTKDDPSFNILVNSIKEKNWDKLAKDLSSSVFVKEFFNGEMQVVNGEVQVQTDTGWKPVPLRLGTTIKTYISENLPWKPLVKFAQKLLKNPSSRSIEQLFEFIEANNITITDDGSFIAYKRVRSDFKDIYSGKFDNSPGTTPEMPRSAVNDDPNVTCSFGLHVAAWDYARFIYSKSPNDIVVLCKVSPEDVVSVPTDYNQQKMRVCKYTVVEIMKEKIEGSYYKTSVETAEDDK